MGQWRGEGGDDVVEEEDHGAGIGGAAGEDGLEGAVCNAAGDAGEELFFGEGLVGEIFFHEGLVGFGDGLADLMEMLGNVEIRGIGDLLAGQIDGLFMQKIHIADALAVALDWHGQRADAGAEGRFDLSEGLEEVGMFLVEAGDEEGDALAAGALIELLGADVDPVFGADDEQGDVCGADALDGLADKAEVAGGIDEVDLGVFPFGGAERGRERNLALDLFGAVVGTGIARGDISRTIDRFRGEKQSLGQRCFTVRAVTGDTDVAQGGRCVVFHSRNLLFAALRPLI